jgi:hypothetical protein
MVGFMGLVNRYASRLRGKIEGVIIDIQGWACSIEFSTPLLYKVA